MSFKRNLSPDVFKSRKKIFSPTGTGNAFSNTANATTTSVAVSPVKNKDSTSDTQKILEHLHSIFPVEKFNHRLPPIIFKHQLYSISKNKTETDRELVLRNKDEIRYFHLGIDSDDLCIVFTPDYERHVMKFNKQNPVVDKFLNVVFKECPDVFLSREALTKFQIGDEEISELFKAGALTARDVGSWWISIPGAGEFVKCFLCGRKTLLSVVRKSRFGEILQSELETRKVSKVAKLGIMYHIHDIVGAQLVDCIYTSSGRLLREKD